MLVAVTCAWAIAIAAGCGTSTTTSVGPTPVKCEMSLPSPSRSIGAAGATVNFTVETQAECTWSATTTASWISQIAPASGQGAAQIEFRAAANNGPARTGTLAVADQTFTVNQAGGCSYTITPAAQMVGAAGGSVTVSVGGGGGCPWTATSHAAWIAVTSGASGSGDGSVRFTVGAHTGPQRSGTLTIAGRTFTVTQASGCTFSIAPSAGSFDRFGGEGKVTVAAPSDCAWAAASQDAWIQIRSVSSGPGPGGSGDGEVEYVVMPVPPLFFGIRTGTMIIAGRTFTVTQGD